MQRLSLLIGISKHGVQISAWRSDYPRCASTSPDRRWEIPFKSAVACSVHNLSMISLFFCRHGLGLWPLPAKGSANVLRITLDAGYCVRKFPVYAMLRESSLFPPSCYLLTFYFQIRGDCFHRTPDFWIWPSWYLLLLLVLCTMYEICSQWRGLFLVRCCDLCLKLNMTKFHFGK
jgi:hypothetical protein